MGKFKPVNISTHQVKINVQSVENNVGCEEGILVTLTTDKVAKNKQVLKTKDSNNIDHTSGINGDAYFHLSFSNNQ
jgi:hypothetical protein